MKKFIAIASVAIFVILAGFIFFKYYFVFGRGVKAGELNYMVEKGVVFKTFEGKLIQSGFRSSSKIASGTAVQSNEFEFSVEDAAIADTLMLNSGRNMELRYKEYKGALPWRGFSKYVVYEVVHIDR